MTFRHFLTLVLILSVQAFAVCMTPANGTTYKCERYVEGDSWCIGEHGHQFRAYKTDATCTKSLEAKLIKDAPEKKLASQVDSLLDEVKAQLTQIDRVGISSQDILYGNISTVEVSSFSDSIVKSILSKLRDAKLKLHSTSMINFEVNSKDGKNLVQMATKYLQLVARVHQLYANLAHKYLKNYSSFDFKTINDLSLKLHKKFALEILSKLNLKAKHLNKDEMEILISEEEKQNFEYMSIQTPDSKDKYAKLVQFLAIREAVTNRWAVQRLTPKTINDPAVNQCGGNFLTYRPKSDGSALRMGSSEAYQELTAYDKFWNDYVPLISDLEAITITKNILDNSKSKTLVDSLIKSIPTIEYTLISDFGWSEEEVSDWAGEVATILTENEALEWKNFARTILSVSVFPGDSLNTDKIVNRIIDDSYMIRSEAIIAQLISVLEILPEEDLKELRKITIQYLDSQRAIWANAISPALKKLVSKIHESKTIVDKNYSEKIKEGVEAVKYALPAAHFINDLNNGITSKKYVASKLNSYSKLDSNLLDPSNPQELIVYFTMKLGTMPSGKRIQYSMDNSSAISEAAQEFFSLLSEKFSAKLKNNMSKVEQAKILYTAANEISKTLQNKYPYDYEYNYNRRPDNRSFDSNKTNANPVIYPLINGSNSSTFTNTSGVTYNTNSLTDINNFHYENPNNKNSSTTATTKSATSYDVMNMIRLSPVVADNTRVAIDKRIMQYNKLQEKNQPYNPYRAELMLNDKAEFFYFLFQMLGTGVNTIPAGKKANPSFLKNLNDQKIMAEHFMGEAYNGVPLLKIELSRNDVFKSQTHCSGTGASCYTTTWYAESEEPALIRLVQNKKYEQDQYCNNGKFAKLSAKKVTNMTPAISFPSFNTTKIDENAIKCVVNEVIEVARKAVGEKHAKFNKTQMQLFCDADFTDYKNDDDYKTLFKSVTAIRESITNDQSVAPQQAEKYKQWDEQLQKDTRYWHERINEDFIEPMLWVAAAIFIVGTIVISWLGSAGTLAPATVALLLMIIDVADIAATGASIYFKGMTNFYELPAQAKFQKSLAISQIGDTKFTTFEDVKVNEANIKMGKMMMGFEALFAPIVGAQFSQSAKRFTGITGKNALKKFGLPVRHFGQPPKSVLVKRSFNTLKKEFGIVGALTRKTSDMVTNAKKWLPRYQPYTSEELKNTVRVGLVQKADEVGLSHAPWNLTAEVERMIKRIDDRLIKNGEFTSEFANANEVFKTEAKLTFKEKLTNPFYNKELFIPKTLIRALKKGGLKNYISNFGDTLESLNRLRTKFLNGKMEKLKLIKNKLDDVKELAEKNPNYIKNKGFKNYFDYFQSTLSHEEIKIFKEISDHERNVVKMITGNYQGQSHAFHSVFKDYENILETIEPFKSTITGQSLRASRYYKNPVTEIIQDNIDEVSDEVRIEDDLVEFYESMLKQDAVENLDDNMLIMTRRDIEDKLY